MNNNISNNNNYPLSCVNHHRDLLNNECFRNIIECRNNNNTISFNYISQYNEIKFANENDNNSHVNIPDINLNPFSSLNLNNNSAPLNNNNGLNNYYINNDNNLNDNTYSYSNDIGNNQSNYNNNNPNLN